MQETSSRALPHAAPAALPLVLCFLLANACRSSDQGQGTVSDLVRHGEYVEAVELAERNAHERPESASAQRTLQRARLALILDQGRRAVFAGEPEIGLEYFHSAEELAPDDPIVRDWIQKTKRQLAEEWRDRAHELVSGSDLNAAEVAFEKVLLYEPDDLRAKAGLARILFLKNYREGLSRTYFNDGLRQFSDFFLDQADRSFHVSNDVLPNEPAQDRREQVQDMLAEERVNQARSLEADGLYFAARNEYRLALLIDPTLEVARDGLDRMDREVRASHILEEVDMGYRRGDFEEADERLAKAALLTSLQSDEVAQRRGSIEEARLRRLYDEALSLERDFRYEAAVEAYARLVRETEGYEDAVERQRTLDEWIALAARKYEAALAAGGEEALGHFKSIEVFWPEYRDIQERIPALERELAAAREAESGGS